jgi:hypothetical protein
MVLRESVWLRGRLVFQDGFFVLGGRLAETEVARRQRRFLDAARKFKKLRRAVRYFSLFPFVRAVFACNNLAWRNTAHGSDIDLFIVVSPGTIWLSRLLLVLPFVLFKKRPSPHSPKAVDPFCFSFFITTDHLSLEKICLPESDPYMAYWLASLVAVLDRDEIQKQLRVENKWVFDQLPNCQGQLHGWSDRPIREVASNHQSFETFAKHLQTKCFPKAIKTAANLDSRVMISDSILKFHLNDRRAVFREEWKKIYEAFGVG